mmetsp:Transcript_84446/g.202410  ORF Transcript_84446/g.202410 Transcript_84446/m.202410 type:complete len:377 (-) Transcript_84446:392-1522(-)
MLPWMDIVDLCMDILVLLIDVSHLQAARKLGEHLVGVLVSDRLEVGVLLHGHNATETVIRSPNLCHRRLPFANNPAYTLHLIVALQRRMVQHHACHRAPQCLQSHGRPATDFLPLLVCVFIPIRSMRQLDVGLGLHPCIEVQPLVLIASFQPVHERNGVISATTIQRVLLLQYGLAIVRNQDRDARDEWCPERLWDGQPEPTGQSEKPPLHFGVRWPMRVRNEGLASSLHDGLLFEEIRYNNPKLGGAVFCTSTGQSWLDGLAEAAPLDAPGAFRHEGLVCHELVPDFIFVPHVLYDAVPDQGELASHLPALYMLLDETEDFFGHPFGNLGHGILEAESANFTRALNEVGANAEEGATKSEPHPCVSTEEEEGCEP